MFGKSQMPANIHVSDSFGLNQAWAALHDPQFDEVSVQRQPVDGHLKDGLTLETRPSGYDRRYYKLLSSPSKVRLQRPSKLLQLSVTQSTGIRWRSGRCVALLLDCFSCLLQTAASNRYQPTLLAFRRLHCLTLDLFFRYVGWTA